MLSALFIELTAGLLYPSESDRPFTVKVLGGTRFSETTLRAELGIDFNKPSTEADLGRFFGNWADPQPWHDDGYRAVQQRMASLRSALEGRPGVRVFRFQAVESDWVIVVPENRGFTVLHTQSVET